MTVPRAIILAAGRGERMAHLTRVVPKPLLTVGGVSLIERQIQLLSDAGIGEFIINISFGADLVRAALGDGHRLGVKIVYSDEGPSPLETAGGIRRALPLLGNKPFIVANADIVTTFDYAQLVAIASEQGAHSAFGPAWQGTLVLVENPAHHIGGDFGLAADGFITTEAPRLTYAGIAILDPKLFRNQSDGYLKLRPVLDAAIAQSSLHGLRHDGLWIDVGTPERLAEAQRRISRPT